MFDWPEHGTAAIENHLSSIFLGQGLNLMSCTAVKGRGKFTIKIFIFKNKPFYFGLQNIEIKFGLNFICFLTSSGYDVIERNLLVTLNKRLVPPCTTLYLVVTACT